MISSGKSIKVMPVAMLVAVAVLSIKPAFADNCGKEDRAYLPSCVWNTTYHPTENWHLKDDEHVLYNKCEGPVTLKIDYYGASDKRITIQPNSTEIVKIYQSTVVWCCPRYNKCDY